MSSRINYANNAAVLVDWIRECDQLSPESRGDDAAIDFIATWLADGGSMARLCEQYGLNWGTLAAWVRKDQRRNERFAQAMVDRKAYRQERLIDGWWDTAQSNVEEAAGHGDVHKARESLAKTMGMFKEEVSVSGGVTVRFDAVDAKA